MIFKYNFTFDIKLIQSFIKTRNLKILDYGCGTGAWSKNSLTKSSVKKITLYDKNKKLIKILKKKYNHKKVEINFNLKSIIKKKDYNLIFVSSVIQYINYYEFRKLIENILNNKKKRKKNLFIIITDIPKFARPIELLLMPIFNFKRFIFVLSMFFNKEYKKLKFYIYKKEDFNFLDKNFKISFEAKST